MFGAVRRRTIESQKSFQNPAEVPGCLAHCINSISYPCGASIFLDGFPSVNREQVIAVFEAAKIAGIRFTHITHLPKGAAGETERTGMAKLLRSEQAAVADAPSMRGIDGRSLPRRA